MRPRKLPWMLLVLALGWPQTGASAPPREEEERPKRKVMAPPAAAPAVEMMDASDFAYEFEAGVVDGEMLSPEGVAVTQGGVQDVDHARDRIEAGEVPLPEHFTVSGLLSEHDLPSPSGPACPQTLCVRAETTESTLVTDPRVHYLVHLGFGSNLTPDQIERPKLNLVIVVDLSTSMSTRASTAQAVVEAIGRQLGEGDQLSIVTFDTEARLLLPPRAMPDERAVQHAARSLSGGSATAMERGLYAGFEVARRAARGFSGKSRVVLVTDGLPNVGRTGPGTFSTLARQGAQTGVGLTTIGVGAHFGAPLVQSIAAVRGGNAFFMRGPDHANQKITDEFDTMVTELAHAFELRVDPAPGMRVLEVYGVPGKMVKRDEDGIRLRVETLFLSRRRGAIYFTMAPKGRPNLPRTPLRVGANLGEVRATYRDLNGRESSDAATMRNVSPTDAGVGLQRGTLLVDQFEAMSKASRSFHESRDAESAWQWVHALADRHRAHPDDDELEPARALVFGLERVLARKTGNATP